MKKTLVLVLACCCSLLMSAQKKAYSFSLQEAVKFALDSSYTAQNANKEVAKALKQKWEATAAGLPQINAEGSYTFTPNIPISVIDFGDGQPQEVPFGIRHAGSVSATLTQLIFDGSYLVGLQAASAFVNYTYTQREKQELLITEGITNSYGAVLLTKESIAILESNIENIESNLNELQKIYENGLTEEESVEQLQITLLQLKNQLNNTQRLDEISHQMLKLSLGIPLSSKLILTDTLESITVQTTTSDIVLKDFDINKNNDYKLSELLVEQRRLELRLEKSKALPSVSAFAQIGTTANNSSFEIFRSADQKWFYNSAIGASINVPIFSSLSRSAKTKRAKFSYEQAVISHTENTEKIRLGYQQAKSDYEFAIDNLNTLEQNLKLSERIEQKNQTKFNEGIATSFELRQAQTQLFSAQQEYLQAQLQLIQSKATLQSILNVFNL